MVTEHAHLVIDPTRSEEFEQAVASLAPLFKVAPGCRGVTLEREIEYPERYRLNIVWDRIEDHMDLFRNSPAFERWRETIGPFFVEAPVMIHASTVVEF